MTTREITENYIQDFLRAQGLDPAQSYNSLKKTWYWQRGSAKVEIFIQSVPMGETSRDFLRLLSPIVKLPADHRENFFLRLLEINDACLGVKLTILPGSTQVYAAYERDIAGMDYHELSECVLDLGWWADFLDDKLVQEFGASF